MQSAGTITNAYATGAVSGSSNVGGLVGFASSFISNAYATGAVSGSGGSRRRPGRPGNDGGTITNAYATGAVSGSGDVGGLVGFNSGGTVTNGYYDTDTTGQPAGGAGTGLTTRQLQGLDPISGSTYFSLSANLGDTGSTWGGGSGGLYPYLKVFFPNGVQAISGFAYQGIDGTPAASGANGAVTVGLDAGGSQIGQATTGANGYYYIIVPAGTLASGEGLVAYTTANSSTGAQTAASYVESVTGASGVATSVLLLYGGFQTLVGGAADTTLSGLNSLYAAAIGSTARLELPLANLEIFSAAASFTLDAPISLSGTLVLSSAGPVSQSAGLNVGALLLLGAQRLHPDQRLESDRDARRGDGRPFAGRR